jgi:hypothetical protein
VRRRAAPPLTAPPRRTHPQTQLEQLLLLEPHNKELSDMYDSLAEVIQLTKDLLADAKAAHDARGGSGGGGEGGEPAGAGPSSSAAAAAAAEAASGGGGGSGALGASQVAAPAGLLPGAVADQIRRAQQRSALAGQAPAAWAVGAECLAYYAADGQWYPGVVEGVAEDGKFVVLYEGYGTKEEARMTFWKGGCLGQRRPGSSGPGAAGGARPCEGVRPGTRGGERAPHSFSSESLRRARTPAPCAHRRAPLAAGGGVGAAARGGGARGGVQPRGGAQAQARGGGAGDSRDPAGAPWGGMLVVRGGWCVCVGGGMVWWGMVCSGGRGAGRGVVRCSGGW